MSPVKIIEIIADTGHQDTIQGIAEQYGVIGFWCGAVNEDGRMSVKILLNDDYRQATLNSIQSLLQAPENANIIVSPVVAVLPEATEKNVTTHIAVLTVEARRRRGKTGYYTDGNNAKSVFNCGI